MITNFSHPENTKLGYWERAFTHNIFRASFLPTLVGEAALMWGELRDLVCEAPSEDWLVKEIAKVMVKEKVEFTRAKSNRTNEDVHRVRSTIVDSAYKLIKQ